MQMLVQILYVIVLSENVGITTFFKKNRFFSLTVHPNHSYPFSHSFKILVTSSLPQIHFPFISPSDKSKSPRETVREDKI